MSDQTPHDTQPVPCEMVLETLDREGDVILAPGGNSTSQRQFLVSSKVLSLASPVFAALFGPQFLEGSRMAEDSPITINLDEDDAKAMGITLQILHHQTPPEIEELTTEEMVTLAMLSDKYDCAGVIRPWASNWLLRHKNIACPRNYGLILTAAHFLRASDEFVKISRKAILTLTKTSVETWEDMDIVNILPRNIRRALRDKISSLRYDIHKAVQSIEGDLRFTRQVSSMEGKVCGNCGVFLPSSDKNCHKCWTVTLYPRMCTLEHRISEYFAVLRKVGLWPSLDPFADRSIFDLASCIKRAREELRQNHLCEKGFSCHLITCVGKLCEKIDKILNDTKGLPLYPLSG